MTATIIVTGWTFGIAANTTRPAAAAAARAATRASSRLRLGPVSIAAMTSATATTAAKVTTSSMDGLTGRRLVSCDPAPVHRDRGGGDVCHEPEVVAHDDHAGSARSQAADEARQVALAAAVHSTCGLVEHHEMGRIAVTVAIASRWRSPLDRSRGCSDAAHASSKRSSSAAARSRRVAGETPRFLRPYSTSSSAVSWSR